MYCVTSCHSRRSRFYFIFIFFSVTLFFARKFIFKTPPLFSLTFANRFVLQGHIVPSMNQRVRLSCAILIYPAKKPAKFGEYYKCISYLALLCNFLCLLNQSDVLRAFFITELLKGEIPGFCTSVKKIMI